MGSGESFFVDKLVVKVIHRDNSMVFKRVLHPVGQGAFFSEHFYEDSGINYFNVVYDCGEKRTTKHLDPEIENTFHVVDSTLLAK